MSIPGRSSDPALLPAERYDNDPVLSALQSLPERWQRAIWYADVLQKRPQDIAPLMGIAPYAAPCLVRRARKGLREAYLSGVGENGRPSCVPPHADSP